MVTEWSKLSNECFRGPPRSDYPMVSYSLLRVVCVLHIDSNHYSKVL